MLGIAPGFEINQKRLPPGSPAGLRIADNLSNWGIVCGDAITAHQLTGDLTDLEVTLGEVKSGEPQTIEQVASGDHIDPRYDSVAILARRLADYGHALEPGQHVITGAYGKTPFAPGHFTGHFSLGIGDVCLTLTGS